MDDSSLPGDWPRYLLGALAVGVILALLFFRRSDFVIQLRGGRLSHTGRLPFSRSNLEELLLEDLGLTGPLKIAGCQRGGRLQLWFRGNLTKGQEQRIRNYLLAIKR